MKIKNYMGVVLLLGACATPTTSINIDDEPSTKEGFLFYIDEDTHLHHSELLTQIQLPSADYIVPDILNLLPNALREYRSGTHQGIDFSIPLNAPVKAVFDGVVIRSNPHHNEVDIDTFKGFLETSHQLGKTPDDIYQYILLGKSIIIDHGYNITKKYRTISVYAHLSSIPERVVPGTKVSKGDLIGFSGNTGTSDGALKNKKGAHLHWELHFDDKNQRYYLGQNIPQKNLKDNIDLLFSN